MCWCTNLYVIMAYLLVISHLYVDSTVNKLLKGWNESAGSNEKGAKGKAHGGNIEKERPRRKIDVLGKVKVAQ